MRYSVSDTAEYGDYTAGPRIVTEQTRETMRQLLREIKDGSFARKWIKENETGREWFEATREKEQTQQIEKVGEELRAMMTFLDPVTVKQTGKRTKVPA
jgi:ketol-acid reductoisomerase